MHQQIASLGFDPEPDSNFLLLLIPLATICLVYGYLLFLSLKSLKRIGHTNGVKIGKVFYFIIFLALVIRSISYILIGIEMIGYYSSEKTGELSTQVLDKVFLSLYNVPDIFVVLSFSIYCWVVFMVFFMGLFQPNTSIKVLTNFENRCFFIWLIFAASIEIAKAVGFVIYWFGYFDSTFEVYLMINSLTNIWMAFLVVASELYLHFIYSGIPFKADFHGKRFKHLNYILLFWGLGRAYKGALGIIQKDEIEEIWKAIVQQEIASISNVLGVFLLILEAFVSEIVPLLLVNDSKVLSFLFLSPEESNRLLLSLERGGSSLSDRLLDDSVSDLSPNRTISVFNGNSRLDNKSEGNKPIITDSRQVRLTQKEEAIHYEILGIFFEAMFREESLIARIIKLKKITPYLVDEVKRELTRFSGFSSPFLLKIRGFSLQETESEIHIYYENVKKTSLYDILHQKQNSSGKLDFTFKLRLALQIAKVLKYLHSLESKIVHGQLHPKNLWLDKDYKIKALDYGLCNLKKYANIMDGYTNVSPYTAPEIISPNGKILVPDNISVDIYSFGVITWELVTEQKPFDDLSIAELYQLIKQENSRPKIPLDSSEEIQNLIRSCWQTDPVKRPKINEIIQLLENQIQNLSV